MGSARERWKAEVGIIRASNTGGKHSADADVFTRRFASDESVAETQMAAAKCFTRAKKDRVVELLDTLASLGGA